MTFRESLIRDKKRSEKYAAPKTVVLIKKAYSQPKDIVLVVICDQMMYDTGRQ